MRYKEYKLDVDLEVLSLVETVSELAIAESHHYGMRPGTVRASLKRLMEAGKVKRRWDGNPMYGRYLYHVPSKAYVPSVEECLALMNSVSAGAEY